MTNPDNEHRPGPERRKHRRVSLNSPVPAQVAGQDVLIVDVSEGGVLLRSPLPFEGIFPLAVEQPPLTAWVRVVGMMRVTSGEQVFLLHAAFVSALDQDQRTIVHKWMAESVTP
jgi:hypothetical protein